MDYEVRLHRVDPDGVEVLKLILQPIVENSLLYGMDGLDHTLRIRVAAWRRGEKLILTVTDNGVGMDKAALAALRGQIIHGRRPKAEANYRSTASGCTTSARGCGSMRGRPAASGCRASRASAPGSPSSCPGGAFPENTKAAASGLFGARRLVFLRRTAGHLHFLTCISGS